MIVIVLEVPSLKRNTKQNFGDLIGRMVSVRFGGADRSGERHETKPGD